MNLQNYKYVRKRQEKATVIMGIEVKEEMVDYSFINLNHVLLKLKGSSKQNNHRLTSNSSRDISVNNFPPMKSGH